MGQRTRIGLAMTIAVLGCVRGSTAETDITVVPTYESEAAGLDERGLVLTPDMPLRIDVSFFNQSDDVVVLPFGWQGWFAVSVASACHGVPSVDSHSGEGEEALASFLALNPCPVVTAFDEPDGLHEIGPRQVYRTTLTVTFETLGPFGVLVHCKPPSMDGKAAGLSRARERLRAIGSPRSDSER